MNQGAFSVTLAINDLAAAQAFHEKLGWETIGRQAEQGWIIRGKVLCDCVTTIRC